MKSRLTILVAASVLAAVFLASCQKVYLGDIEDRLGRLEETVDSLSRIQTGVQTISREMKSLADSVSALKERVSTQGSGADASRVQALEESVRNLQAWASSLDGIGATIEDINTALATHSDSLSTLDASLRGTDAAISALQAQVEAVQSALEAASQDPGSGAAVAGLIASVNALEPKVSTLEGTVATLQESLSSLIGRVDSMELELAGIDDQIAGIGTTIAGLRTAVEALQSSSASTSSQVQSAIAALEARIAALEQLQESLATKEWAEATFATLDAQAQTAADLAGVQAAVGAALAGMPEGKTVTEAIAAASQSVRDWVNEQLDAYCTAGEIEGKLSAMKTELAAQVAALGNKADSLDTALSAKIGAAEASIDSLSAALEDAKAEITTAYTNAINSAIVAAKEELGQEIDDSIAAAIDAANANISTLDGKVTDLGTDVAALQSRLDDVEGRLDGHDADIEALKAMVQSVVFVPKYEGGCAVVRTTSDLNSLTLEYEVFPQTCASAIATAWASDNSILALNSRTVLTRSGLASIPITDVAYNSDSKLLEVSVKLDGVTGVALSSGAALAVSLTINTGATTVSSPFSDIVMPRIVDLSAGGTANCYIVKEAGEYKFNAKVRGNGKTTGGTDADAIALTNATAQVLWESFGTADTPAPGSLVNSAVLDGNNVLFSATSNTGNAVIAVKDAGGNILWSWHIWLAGEQPQGQVYNNNAGTMMDRNLGATSAEKGNPGALGLLYQWGRKDPFLGGNGISSSTQAASTGSWSTTAGPKTVDEAVKNPTTFIKSSEETYQYDWTSSQDNDLWKSSKTMYDPCPAGYRVPDGGDTGVWYKAFNSDYWETANNWDGTYKGMDFGRTDKPLGSGMIWYPAAGFRELDGTLNDVGSYGYYWSCTVSGTSACSLRFNSYGDVYPFGNSFRAFGFSVRCLSESR